MSGSKKSGHANIPKALLETPFLRLKACRDGPMLFIAGDEYVGRSLDLYGEFSAGEAKIFSQVLRSGMVAVDAGANIGCHTVAMARAVAPKGAVFALEAQRILHQVLCANVTLCGLTNVVTHHAALGERAGSIRIPAIDYTKTGNFGGLTLGDHARGEKVPVMTIDSLALPACHFIKIDVEGMERDVLEGASETIAAFQPVLYVENDRRDKSHDLIAWLLDRNYRLYWHLPRLYNPENFFGNPDNVFGRIISRNIFCLPENSPVSVTNFQEILSPDESY